MGGEELKDDAGEGQLALGMLRLDCSYSVTFYEEGRRRVYHHMSGTVLKPNREWRELERRGTRWSDRGYSPAMLHLADGQVARGFMQVKEFAPAAPGRSVLRFVILTQRPYSQTV